MDTTITLFLPVPQVLLALPQLVQASAYRLLLHCMQFMYMLEQMAQRPTL